MNRDASRRFVILKSKESVCRIVTSGDKAATGTGFFVTAEGIVITCNHVVSHFKADTNGQISLEYAPKIFVETPKGSYDARIIHDVNTTHPLFEDYAILKVEVTDSSPLHLGDASLVEPGDDVLVLGFPFGLRDICASSGMVSSKHRSPSSFSAMILLDMLRIDGSVNPGNSGGPLFDLNTRSVVGIVNSKLGNISKQIDRLRGRNDISEDLLDVFENSTNLMNVGIGEAISIRYALNELRQLGITTF